MNTSQHQPETPTRRRLLGLLVGLAVLAFVAVPAAGFAYFALISFMESEPAVGALWGGVTMLLLALPVLAGLVTARLPVRRGRRVRSAWIVASLVVITIVAVSWLSTVV